MKNVEIGRRIRQQRKALDMSVVDIASYTGLSKATIHRYESGDIKNIKLPVLETIATLLDVNPLWLIGKSDNKERTDGRTNDLCRAISNFITYVQETPNLVCGKRLVTEVERRVIANTLYLAKDILDKGE